MAKGGDDVISILGEPLTAGERVLTPEALDFVAGLHETFDKRRRDLLSLRTRRQILTDGGVLPDFLTETLDVRDGTWRVAPAPADLADRRVEITGPVDRKMMINALNSGARIFMADFEDSTAPTWENVVVGQANLIDAVDGSIEFASEDGKKYVLIARPATLFVRPRGWHLIERHVSVDGDSVSASLFDFGIALFHNARRLIERGSGPYFYLPKLESHREARLWNDVFCAAQDRLGIPRGTIRATVLIETIFAAFEMDEILYELREHCAGLNAGRWDYLFSAIKKFRNRSDFVLPDRAQVTMAVPFMRAYAQLLVRTCHRRGAHAIGGMAAFIPNRKDPAANEVALARVREDKVREAGDGFDGTWVAHPDLVPVAAEVFDARFGTKANQLDVLRDDVRVAAADLLDVRVPGGAVTEAGLRTDVGVGIRYVESWLRGVGAAALDNLMEDAATAEISRAQVWQWIRHGVKLPDGRAVTSELVRSVADREIAALRRPGDRFDDARSVFERVALGGDFEEFLTLAAYDLLP
jgi:malate synthase